MKSYPKEWLKTKPKRQHIKIYVNKLNLKDIDNTKINSFICNMQDLIHKFPDYFDFKFELNNGSFDIVAWRLENDAELKEKELHAQCIKLVRIFFKKEPSKVDLWFAAENPLLGDISPDKMIAMGRVEKLLKFIKNQLEDN